MLSDGIQLLQAATIGDLLTENGAALPITGNNVGELFYLTTGVMGLHVFTVQGWIKVGNENSGPTLTAGSGISIVGTAIVNTGVRTIVAGTNIAIDNPTGAVTVSLSGVIPFNKGGTGLSSIAAGYVKSNGAGIFSVDTINASELSGVIQVSAGGTGAGSFVAGWLRYDGTSFASSTSIPGTAISGNITGAAANITGIAALANGGTGVSVLAAGYIKSNGNALQSVSTINASDLVGVIPVSAGGTGAGSFSSGWMSFNGTSFASSASIPGSVISGNITGSSGGISGIVALANGGTGTSVVPSGYVTSNGNGFTSTATIPGSAISGNVASATTATSVTNVGGGAAGSLIYQSSAGNTAFIASTVAGRILTSTGATSAPTYAQPMYDIGLSYGGVAPAGDVMAFTANRPFILASPLTNGYASAHVAPTALTTFAIYKKPAGGSQVQIGTMTFAAGATTASFPSYPSSQSFAVGDMLVFVLGTADSTLTTVAATFAVQLT